MDRVRRLALALLLGLLLAPAAQAEVVATGVEDAGLAVAPDGTPRAAYVRGGAVHIASRSSDGWHSASMPFPLADASALVGRTVASRTLTAVLVEDDERRWIALYVQRADAVTLRWLLTARPGAEIGSAGLALDRRGNPAVAYAFRLSGGQTFLRLVRCAARCVDARVTRAGFPSSSLPPSVSPVLMRDASIRIVEVYAQRASAAIEWRPIPRDWRGRFIFASSLGTPAGRVRVLLSGSNVYSAWTQLHPAFGESHVVLTRRYLAPHDPQAESAPVFRHATLVDLAATADGVEVGANDWTLADGVAVFAGVLAFGATDPVELDGKLVGYAVGPAGARDVLLAVDGELTWFRTMGRPGVRVSLQAAGASPLVLSGRVAGVSGGRVELFAEAPRRFVAAAELAPDGSFSVQVPAPGAATVFRAVYRDPLSGLPFGALLRAPAG